MDVWGVFAGDSTMSYGGSIRGGYYRDYEEFPYGSLEKTSNSCSKDPYSKVQEKCRQIQLKKKECPFCKEHKKRPLVNYMRKRESRKHHESICEDEEEHDYHQEDEEEQCSQTAMCNTKC